MHQPGLFEKEPQKIESGAALTFDARHFTLIRLESQDFRRTMKNEAGSQLFVTEFSYCLQKMPLHLESIRKENSQ